MDLLKRPGVNMLLLHFCPRQTSMNTRQVIGTTLRAFISCLIVLTCVIFVGYQTFNCFLKFAQKPQGHCPRMAEQRKQAEQ